MWSFCQKGLEAKKLELNVLIPKQDTLHAVSTLVFRNVQVSIASKLKHLAGVLGIPGAIPAYTVEDWMERCRVHSLRALMDDVLSLILLIGQHRITLYLSSW